MSMTVRNVDVIKGGFYDDWARGEYPTRPDLWAPDGEVVLSDDFPDPATARGPAARRKLREDWLSAWTSWRMEAEEFIEEGDLVLVPGRVRGTGKGSAPRSRRPERICGSCAKASWCA